MKWLMLIAVVLLAVQFVACDDEVETADELEESQNSQSEDVELQNSEPTEDTASAPFETKEEAFAKYAEVTVNNDYNGYIDMLYPELDGVSTISWTLVAGKLAGPGTWSWEEPTVTKTFDPEGDIIEDITLEAAGVYNHTDGTEKTWDLKTRFIRTDEGWYCYPKK